MDAHETRSNAKASVGEIHEWSGGDLRIPRYLDKLPLMDPGPL